jgi:hypothetical protein
VHTRSHRAAKDAMTDTLAEPDRRFPDITTVASRLNSSRVVLGFWAAYVVVVLIGVVVVVGPANLGWDDSFVAGSTTSVQRVVPGDHIQLAYELWLWRDSLTSLSHFPWTDPYLYAASGVVSSQAFGWPLVLVTLPVDLAWGPIAAYNAVWYLSFVLCAVCTAPWMRSVGVRRWGAAVAGLAFAFAPFRLVQGTAHANAILAWLLPLLLLCLERALRGDARVARRWGWAAAAVQVSIAASGELHFAAFSVMVIVGYVLARLPRRDASRLRRLRAPAVAAVLGSAGFVLLEYVFIVAPSGESDRRSPDEAVYYSARIADFAHRVITINFERFVYPGIAIAIAAVVGAIVSLKSRRWRGFGLTMIVAIVGTALISIAPAYPALRSVYQAVPVMSFSRAPARIWILGALAAAALVGVAVDAVPRRGLRIALAVILTVAILADAPKRLYEALPATAEPYRELPAGSAILELPPFGPEWTHGAPYSLFVMQHPGPRLGGYYILVKSEANAARLRTEPLVTEPGDTCLWRDVIADYDIDYVAVHRDLLGTGEGLRWPADAEHIIGTLSSLDGFELASDVEGVAVFAVDPDRIACPAA